MDRRELKELSKSQLKGNWSVPVLSTLIFIAVSFAVSFIGNYTQSLFLSIIVLLISLALESWMFVAMPNLFLKFSENQEETTLSDLIVSKSAYFKSLGFIIFFTIIIMIISVGIAIGATIGIVNTILDVNEIFRNLGIFIFVGLTISIITTIIQLALAMVPYIIIDKKDVGVFEAISISIKMMKGNKFKLFVIELSFIGWSILALLTLGIGFLWLSPYISLTITNFYKDIKRKYDEIEEEPKQDL